MFNPPPPKSKISVTPGAVESNEENVGENQSEDLAERIVLRRPRRRVRLAVRIVVLSPIIGCVAGVAIAVGLALIAAIAQNGMGFGRDPGFEFGRPRVDFSVYFGPLFLFFAPSMSIVVALAMSAEVVARRIGSSASRLVRELGDSSDDSYEQEALSHSESE